jgi:hypothetical protein
MYAPAKIVETRTPNFVTANRYSSRTRATMLMQRVMSAVQPV